MRPWSIPNAHLRDASSTGTWCLPAGLGNGIVVSHHTLYGHGYTSQYRLENKQLDPKRMEPHDPNLNSTSDNFSLHFPVHGNHLTKAHISHEIPSKATHPGFSGSLSGGSRSRELHQSYGMHVYGEMDQTMETSPTPIQSSRLVLFGSYTPLSAVLRPQPDPPRSRTSNPVTRMIRDFSLR